MARTDLRKLAPRQIQDEAQELDPLPISFFERDTTAVARDLLGRYLVMTHPGEPPRVGRIVETEAYVGKQDRASHASRGRTPRNAPMYEAAGRAYVYFIYGMYWCLNVVTEEVGQPCAVLIRAAEAVSGLEPSASGPGRLCRAFGIDGAFNRANLTDGVLTITQGRPGVPHEIVSAPRVGVAYAGEWAARPLRFFLASSPAVSVKPRATLRRPATPTVGSNVTPTLAPSTGSGQALPRRGGGKRAPSPLHRRWKGGAGEGWGGGSRT